MVYLCNTIKEQKNEIIRKHSTSTTPTSAARPVAWNYYVRERDHLKIIEDYLRKSLQAKNLEVFYFNHISGCDPSVWFPALEAGLLQVRVLSSRHISCSGEVWSSRLFWTQEIAGSNPAYATFGDISVLQNEEGSIKTQ